MAANITDKVTDTRNAARPASTTASGTRASGGTSLACSSLTGWPTASKVHFVTYKIDSNSSPIAGTQLDCYGIVSGNTIGSFTVVDGTDNGNAIGDIVEMLPTAAWAQDLADGLSVGHTRTGAHVSALPLTSPVLTTPVITDYTSAAHDHGDADDGGAIVSAAIPADAVNDSQMVYGKLRSRQGGSATNWATAGTTTYDYSATNTFTQTGSKAVNADPTTITFPTAFNQVPLVVATAISSSASSIFPVITGISATQFTVRAIGVDGGAKTTETISWIAIGE